MQVLGVEPRSQRWQRHILPLNYTCLYHLNALVVSALNFCRVTMSEKDTKNKKEKKRESDRRWLEKNREKKKEYLRKYRQRKKAENIEAYRQSYQQYAVRKKQEDPVGYAESMRKSRRKYAHGIKGFTYEAKRRGIPMELSKQELKVLFSSSCSYCACSDDIGIDRLESDGPYSWANSVSACWTCNKMKNVLSHDEFITMICAITTKHFDIVPKVESVGKRSVYRSKFSQYRWSAKHSNREFKLTLEQFKKCISKPCHYCGLSCASGIDRKDNKIGYTLGNVLPCCWTCNRAKHTFDYDDFLTKCAQIMAVQMSISEPPQKQK